MTDRELLELAAKAAGFVPHHSYREKTNSLLWLSESGFPATWRPLDDDRDALRLAVKLGMHVHIGDDRVFVILPSAPSFAKATTELYDDDPYAATRRAIVRAAAAIGRTL